MIRRALAALAIGATVGLAAGLAVEATDRPDVPRCEEDAVIVGTGDYHGATDRWDAYECVAVDDLAGIR